MSSLTDSLTAALDRLRADLTGIRSGRANPNLIEDVPVEAYDARLRLKEVAAITTPEPRQLLVQPWDRGHLKAVESALRQTDLNLSLSVDGERIRCLVPPLTEERRAEYLSLAREKAEQARIAIRRHRDEELRRLRAAERSGSLSQDAADRERAAVETQVKEAVGHVADSLADKERELLTI